MTLSARGIALQGFAFTPIAIAVQGLIALLVEEEIKRAQGPGGKRRKSYRPQYTPPQPEALTRETVEAQWDLLETRLRNQAEDAAARKAAAKPVTADQKEGAAIEPVAVDRLHDGPPPLTDLSATEKAAELLASKLNAQALAEAKKRRTDEDEAMLLVMLLA